MRAIAYSLVALLLAGLAVAQNARAQQGPSLGRELEQGSLRELLRGFDRETITLPGSEVTPPTQPLVGQDFRAISTGLTDCHIPFEELSARSPSCAGARSGGRRCEQYAPLSFPEVVFLPEAQCTGTLVSSRSVLTAAHCFVGGNRTTMLRGDAPDLVLSPGRTSGYTAELRNATTLATNQRSFVADKIVVHGEYGGQGLTDGRYYKNDLALMRIATSIPSARAVPATFGILEAGQSTIAGYGYSEASGGTFGEFRLTWPEPIVGDGEQMFADSVENAASRLEPRSGFCFGDSGGPVFAGRLRGCSAEPRPRELLGLISYLGRSSTSGGDAQQQVAQCFARERMAMQAINIQSRAWICRITEDEAEGCHLR